MCDEHVEHWSRIERTSRTWKECSECDGLIAPGDRYVKLVSIDHGSAESWNLHVACDELASDVASEIGDDGCRMLMDHSIAYEIRECGLSDHESLPWRALLRWMRVHTRARFAAELARSLESAMTDNVNHPAHYKSGGIETKLIEDLEKAAWHLARAIENIKRDGVTNG